MKNNEDPYIVWEEEYEDATRYYVAADDADGEQQITEVSEAVYMTFQQSVKTERNHKRSDERHREQSEQTDETINKRAFYNSRSVDETVIGKIQYERAIKSLTEIQRRRFIMYDCGYTYEEIAECEKCTFQAAAKSIKAAEEKIKNFFERQG